MLIKYFMLLIENCLQPKDHIDYHPSQVQNTSRTKRSDDYAVHGFYHSYTRILINLDKVLIALHRINPSLHQDLFRMKRFDVLI